MPGQSTLNPNYPGAASTALILIEPDGTEKIYRWKDYSRQMIIARKSLETFGVKPGDFVGVIALNLPESFFVMAAIIMARAVIVPINYPLVKEAGHKEIKFIMNDCNLKLVVANECLIRHLAGSGIACVSFEDILQETDGESQPEIPSIPGFRGDDLLVMPYTSGTTGNPKGVMLTYRNISDRVRAISDVFGVSKKERLLSYLPLGHISELVATFFGQLMNGYTVYFTGHIRELPENREKFRKIFPEILHKVKPTIFLAVPKVWSNLRHGINNKVRYIPVNLSRPGFMRDFLAKKIREKLGLDHARFFVSASARLDPEDKEFFAGLGMKIKDVYGQTETAGPLLVDGNVIGNAKVFAGENDEITVNGDCVMSGYYKDTPADKEKYRTGDIGIWESGSVFYGGRLGDSFKLAQGEFISVARLEELEKQIKKINGVEEVIVCGEGKPYLVALVFSRDQSKELTDTIRQTLPFLGEGLYRIKGFLLLDMSFLEYTSTLKLKRNKIIKKFRTNIDLM